MGSLQRVSFSDYPKEAITFFQGALVRKTGLRTRVSNEDEYGDEYGEYGDEDDEYGDEEQW